METAIDEAQQWERLEQNPCLACRNSLRVKRLRAVEWPPCLVLHVKRWRLGPRRRRWLKDEQGIAFDSSFTRGGKEYSLRAVVCHHGGVPNGHYICFARPTMLGTDATIGK